MAKCAVKAALEEMRHVHGLDEAVPLMKRVGALLGLPLVAVNGDYALGGAPQGQSERVMSEHFGWSADVLNAFWDSNLLRTSPIGAACRVTSRPFAWRLSHGFDCRIPTQMQAPQERVMAFVAGLGVSGGITTPIRLPLGRVCWATWYGLDRKLNYDRILGEYEDLLFLMGHYFLDVVSVGGDYDLVARMTVSLTRREAECLNWVALVVRSQQMSPSKSPSTARIAAVPKGNHPSESIH